MAERNGLNFGRMFYSRIIFEIPYSAEKMKIAGGNPAFEPVSTINIKGKGLYYGYSVIDIVRNAKSEHENMLRCLRA